jgi:hypothetical protein
MPAEKDLPQEIKRLHRWQGVILRAESFEGDVNRLIHRIEELSWEAQPKLGDLSIRDYFDSVLPAMLGRWRGLDAKLAVEENCTVQFNVLGGEDCGSWAIMFRSPSPHVVRGIIEHPDLTITVTQEAMYRILAGKFDAKRSIQLGDIQIQGDLKLLKTVGTLFSGRMH